MSDNWVRIVPTEPTWTPSAEQETAVVRLARELMPGAEDISVERPDEIAFVDAGSNQGEASCPACDGALSEEWWSAATGQSHDQRRFEDRSTHVPCCGALIDLNDLDYGDFPVAFARWWVDCMNPDVGRLSEQAVESIAGALGHAVTIVYQHI